MRGEQGTREARELNELIERAHGRLVIARDLTHEAQADCEVIRDLRGAALRLEASLHAVTRERAGALAALTAIAGTTDCVDTEPDEIAKHVIGWAGGERMRDEDYRELRALRAHFAAQAATIASAEDAPSVPLAHPAAPDAPVVGVAP